LPPWQPLHIGKGSPIKLKFWSPTVISVWNNAKQGANT
jgi:hypothetical protein